jgi:hypothetical protein
MACKLRWEKLKGIYGDRYEVPSYLDLYRQKAIVDEQARARSERRTERKSATAA